MPVTDTKVVPLTSIRIYDHGSGDPVLTDRGFAWYDNLSLSHAYGSSSKTTGGVSKLEYIEGVGLVCRAFVVQQDTRLANYLIGSGSWEERRPTAGMPRKYRLIQYDTTAGLAWSATTDYDLPADPSFAVSVFTPDSPADWNDTTFPPYVRIELGTGQWAVLLDGKDGAHLLQYVSGAWESVMSIPEPANLGADRDERLIIVRVLRGQICVSMDGGRTYSRYRPAGGTASIRAGTLTFRGQGGMCVLGLHQVQYVAGVYTSATRNTFTNRLAPTATITGRETLPAGTSIAYADASTPGSGIARYTATLTPVAITNSLFTFYWTPEVYAVEFTYPVVRSLAWESWTEAWDNNILELVIEKPFDLSEGTCRGRVRLDATTDFTGNYRWRKIIVQQGWLNADATITWYTTFTGYLADVDPRQEEYNKVKLSFTAENNTIRFRRAEWTALDARPLGGRTLNQALDLILDSEGLQASYRSWHAIGDVFTLPKGLAEDPFELPPKGESKWETMVRLCRYAQLEIAVYDDGTFVTGPVDFVQNVTSKVWQASPTSALADAILAASNLFSARESATAVIVEGVAETGEQLLAYAVDTQAEQNRLSGRFSPWREPIQEEMGGTCTLGALASRAQALATEYFAEKFEPEVVAPIDLAVARRDRVRVEGIGQLGGTNFHEYVVLSLRHVYVPSIASCETTAGLRRRPEGLVAPL